MNEPVNPPVAPVHCMRCAKFLGGAVEPRLQLLGELMLLDDVVRLKAALEVALKGERVANENLTATQARCTELIQEKRAVRQRVVAWLRSEAFKCMPDLRPHAEDIAAWLARISDDQLASWFP